MKNIKYRIPGICRNGHKIFIYCEVDDSLIFKDSYDVSKCKCDERGIIKRYERSGENQLCIGMKDKADIDIFESDIVYDGIRNYLVIYEAASLSFRLKSLLSGACCAIFASDQKDLKVVGNVHMNPKYKRFKFT